MSEQRDLCDGKVLVGLHDADDEEIETSVFASQEYTSITPFFFFFTRDNTSFTGDNVSTVPVLSVKIVTFVRTHTRQGFTGPNASQQRTRPWLGAAPAPAAAEIREEVVLSLEADGILSWKQFGEERCRLFSKN